MSVNTKIAMGSLTNMWTAAHVAKFASEGKVDLDSLATPYIDNYMKSGLGDTTAGIYGEWINDVTIRQLLTMRSGLPDMDAQLTKVQGIEYSPFDIISMSSKTQLFAPGTGGAYSSIGYIFLGFLLTNLTDSSTYQGDGAMSHPDPNTENVDLSCLER